MLYSCANSQVLISALSLPLCYMLMAWMQVAVSMCLCAKQECHSVCEWFCCCWSVEVTLGVPLSLSTPWSATCLLSRAFLLLSLSRYRRGILGGIPAWGGGGGGEDPAPDGFESEVCREEWMDFVCVCVCVCVCVHVQTKCNTCFPYNQCHHIQTFVRAKWCRFGANSLSSHQSQ